MFDFMFFVSSLGCIYQDQEIADGETVMPHNEPCKLCTCNKGVLSCERKQCNCSSWMPGSGREMCCDECDPKESCQHQELSHVYFKSGEKWMYECQACECLVRICQSMYG